MPDCVGFTVVLGRVLYAHAAFPIPVVNVGYKFVVGPWLHPHHVAGTKVANPIFDPALHEKGADAVEEVSCEHPGGFSPTGLSGQGVTVMMEGFTVIEGSVVYPHAALPVPVVKVG